MPKSTETLGFARELNHRVKNNFQIIVSLMNLKKRLMPPERREDIRFIEEHVMAMAVAYRQVYATGEMVEVEAAELIGEFALGLRQSAGLPAERLALRLADVSGPLGLDQAIAVGLYLAVVLPPYLDHAAVNNGRVTLTAALADATLHLDITSEPATLIQFDVLRTRLMRAYVTQLNATHHPNAANQKLSIPITRNQTNT